MDYVRRVVWGMLYADDACIVSRSPQGLAKVMEVIVEVCRAFGLTVSAKKTETMCMPPPRTPRMMVRIEAAGLASPCGDRETMQASSAYSMPHTARRT